MLSFEYAADNGAAMFETDLRFSSDGVVVIMHDATLDRTTNCTGNVSDHTLSELRACDAGAWLAPAFAGTQIPTLVEVFAFAAARGVSVVLDLKVAGLGPAILAALARAPPLDSARLLPSVNFRADIAEMRASLPRSTLLLNAKDYPVPKAPDVTYFGDLRQAGVDVIFATAATSCAPAFVRLARGFGVQVWGWTVDGAGAWAACIEAGLPVLCTNDPAHALGWASDLEGCAAAKCSPGDPPRGFLGDVLQ